MAIIVVNIQNIHLYELKLSYVYFGIGDYPSPCSGHSIYHYSHFLATAMWWKKSNFSVQPTVYLKNLNWI